MDKQDLIAIIQAAFSQVRLAGDPFRSGFEGNGDEAADLFRSTTDWQAIDAAVLDANYDALSFMSEAGFRFFIPAYLVADLNEQLDSADPTFNLGVFMEDVIELPVGDTVFEKPIGPSVLFGPRGFGALTAGDYARYRNSVFTREEAGAIVAYLEYRRGLPDAVDGDAIDTALESFWRDRAENAPTAETLADHLRAEREYWVALGIPLDDGDS